MHRIVSVLMMMVVVLSVAACKGREDNSASQATASGNANAEALPAKSQGKNLEEEMARLKVSTALVLPSSKIAHLPLWSPEGDQIASMVGNRWYKVDLKQIELHEFDWKSQKVGQALVKESVALASTIEMRRWQQALKTVPENQQVVTTKDGMKLELRKEGAKTSLIFTKSVQNPRTLWSVEENCQSLTLSPDEKYVAFVGETSGVFVVNLSAL
jgi:hypothetical protein